MVRKKQSRVISLYIILIIALSLFFSAQTKGVQASTEFGHATIQVQNINYSSKTLTLLFDFYDTTNTSDTNGRSSSWLWFTQSYGSAGLSFLSNDTNWVLIGNNGAQWDWKIEKTIEVNYYSFGETYDAFPFENYGITFYIDSNFTRTFDSWGSSIPNFDCSLNGPTGKIVNGNEAPFFFASPQYQGLYDYQKFDVTVSQNFTSIFAGLTIYTLFIILIIMAVFLVRKRLEMELSNSITILSGVLVFLPILLFTFRTSYAPNSLTPVDIAGFLIMIGYGAILLFDIAFEKAEKRQGEETRQTKQKQKFMELRDNVNRVNEKERKAVLFRACIFIALGIGLTSVVDYSFQTVLKIPLSDPILWLIVFVFTTIIWGLMIFLMLTVLPPFKKFLLKWFATDVDDEQTELLKTILTEQKKMNENFLKLQSKQEEDLKQAMQKLKTA
jgi:hypothetical protein